MNNSRTDMSGRNVVYSIIGRVAGMITSFVGRSIFVHTLNSEYLGLGGLFGNIFSIISLCELGMGAAIAQSLYKPLADRDEKRIAAVMGFYTRVNRVVATLTLFFSLAAMPLLPSLAKSSINGDEICTAYILFALHTALSYMLSAKKNLVVCDQRLYVVTAVNTLTSVLALGVQALVLIQTKNYIFYLVTRIFLLALRDIAINRYADKKYPFISKKIKPTKGYYSMIYSNVKALLWHKAGGTVCRSTDSLLLSMCVGLSGMGKYSNYALVIGTVGAFFDVVINAVSASVGNLGAGDRGKKSENVMRKMYFLNFFMLTVGLCVLVSTVNPFIKLWLGDDMLFSTAEMAVIAGCFYFSCIRDPVQIFINAYGLFRQTRFIPVARAAVNLVLSVMFVKSMGIFGVFLGTLVSTVTVPLYFEVKMLYKYGFGNAEMTEFLVEMCSYVVTSMSTAFLCYTITSLLPETPLGIVAKGGTALGISFVVLLVMYGKSVYFAFCTETMKRFVVGKKRKKVTSA